MLKYLATGLLVLIKASSPATASSPDSWAAFSSQVEHACLEAAAERLSAPSATVDPFGSESYGLAVVTGKDADGSTAGIICVFDKRTGAVETGGEIVPAPLPIQGLTDVPAEQSILQPLAAADIDKASLGGELVCTFSSEDGSTLFFASGIVASDEPAQAILKIDGALQKFAAPGGFNPIVHGAAFSGADAEIDITVTGPPTEAGESPARPATLALWPKSGNAFKISGSWTCGP